MANEGTGWYDMNINQILRAPRRATRTVPFPSCLCYRFPDQNTEGFAGGLQPSQHQRNTRTSSKHKKKTVK